MNFTTNSTEVFLGQNIRFSLNVRNFYNANSVVEVRVSLHCNGKWYNCDEEGYELLGPHIATLTSRANSSTDYVLKAASEDYNAGNLLEIFLLEKNGQLQDALTLLLRPWVRVLCGQSTFQFVENQKLPNFCNFNKAK